MQTYCQSRDELVPHQIIRKTRDEEIIGVEVGQSVAHHTHGISNVTVLHIGALMVLIEESAREGGGAVKIGSEARDGKSACPGSDLVGSSV